MEIIIIIVVNQELLANINRVCRYFIIIIQSNQTMLSSWSLGKMLREKQCERDIVVLLHHKTSHC